MARSEDNFFKQYSSLIRRISWLTATLLCLALLISCSSGETNENSEKTDAGNQLRPQIAEGLKLTREKKYEDATTKVHELINKDPKDAEALSVMSYILLKSTRFKNAGEMAERALAIDPYLSRPHVVLARVSFQVSGFNKALDLARKALVINPESSGAYQIIGEIYLRKGLTKDAVTVFEEAVRLDPENPELLNLLASGYLKDKQYDQALSTLTAHQAIDSNSPGAHFNLALVYTHMKNGRKAMKHIAKAEYLYTQQDNIMWMGKARDVRRVISKEFKLRPEDIS